MFDVSLLKVCIRVGKTMFGAGLRTPPGPEGAPRPQVSRADRETYGRGVWLGQETGHNRVSAKSVVSK